MVKQLGPTEKNMNADIDVYQLKPGTYGTVITGFTSVFGIFIKEWS